MTGDIRKTADAEQLRRCSTPFLLPSRRSVGGFAFSERSGRNAKMFFEPR